MRGLCFGQHHRLFSHQCIRNDVVGSRMAMSSLTGVSLNMISVQCKMSRLLVESSAIRNQATLYIPELYKCVRVRPSNLAYPTPEVLTCHSRSQQLIARDH